MLRKDGKGYCDYYAPELRNFVTDTTEAKTLAGLKTAAETTWKVWCEIGYEPPPPAKTPPVKAGYPAAQLLTKKSSAERQGPASRQL